MSKFEEWLINFLNEKNIENKLFEIKYNGNIHFIDSYYIIEIIKNCNFKEQEKIKEKLVKIDFYNGNVQDFFEYLAKGYIQINF